MLRDRPREKTYRQNRGSGANLLMELSLAGKSHELSISRLKAVPSNLLPDVAHSYQLCKVKSEFCTNLDSIIKLH